MMRRIGSLVACTLALVVLGAVPAAAHVTVSPERIPRGTADVILTFRVPNESATAATDSLKIQFPLDHPIVVLSPEAGSGWQVRAVTTTLPKPITTDDGTFTSVTSEIEWSGGSIPVGQFGEFNVLAQGIPAGASKLVFKAEQTYSDGTVVSWIEVPTASVPAPAHPAPVVTLTGAGGRAATTTTAAAAVTPAGSGTSDALGISALIVAGAAVLLSLLAVWLGRPRFGAPGGEPADPTGRDGAAS